MSRGEGRQKACSWARAGQPSGHWWENGIPGALTCAGKCWTDSRRNLCLLLPVITLIRSFQCMDLGVIALAQVLPSFCQVNAKT